MKPNAALLEVIEEFEELKQKWRKGAERTNALMTPEKRKKAARKGWKTRRARALTH